jgi:hypothetical protein
MVLRTTNQEATMIPITTGSSSRGSGRAARRACGFVLAGFALAACDEPAGGPSNLAPMLQTSADEPAHVAAAATIDAEWNVTAAFGTAFNSVDYVTACLMFEGDLWDPGETWMLGVEGGGGGQSNLSPPGSYGRTTATLTDDPPPGSPPQGWVAAVMDGTFDGDFWVEGGSATLKALVLSVMGVPTEPASPVGTLELSGELNFGEVPIGTSGVLTATLTNVGSGNLVVAGLGVPPWDWISGSIHVPTQYSLVDSPSTPIVLAPGESVEVAIRFTPAVEGSAGAILEILSTDALCVRNISLVGTGVSTLRVVDIDIRPGSHKNRINSRGHGEIPVAILSNAEFDAATTVNRASLTFGATGDEPSLHLRRHGVPDCVVRDVNRDHHKDLICHFETQLTGFQPGHVEGVLRGQTTDGTLIEGRDAVRIVR